MSSYAEFYIRSNKGEYISIGDFCRSSDIYQVIEDDVVFGKSAPLSKADIDKYYNYMEQTIASTKKSIAEYENKKILVMSANNSLEDKLEVVNSYDNCIYEMEAEIKSEQSALAFFNMLRLLYQAAKDTEYFSENRRIDPENYIYAGIDCGYPDGFEREE